MHMEINKYIFAFEQINHLFDDFDDRHSLIHDPSIYLHLYLIIILVDIIQTLLN